MILSNVTHDNIASAADAAGFRVDIAPLNKRGDRFQVKVRLIVPASARTPRGARRRGEKGDVAYESIRTNFEGKDRRASAVCWHGFRDFFRALYARAPGAVAKTAMAKYVGTNGFEAAFPATGARNIGSSFNPIRADQSCDCDGLNPTDATPHTH